MLALKWALEEHRLIIHGHPVRRSRIFIHEYQSTLGQPPRAQTSKSRTSDKRHQHKKQLKISDQTKRGSRLVNQQCCGYSVDWPDPFCYGWTALHRAASSGKKKTVRYLLDHGWHLKKKTWDGFIAKEVIGMNSYSYGGLGKPNNIKRDLSPEKMELLEWVIGWDKKWKSLCEALHGLYTLQTLRCNKFPELNRYSEIEHLDLCRTKNIKNVSIRYAKLQNCPWVQILVHICTFLIGDFDVTIEYLGTRGLAKFQTFEQAVLKYRNPQYVATKVTPDRALRRVSLSSTTRKPEFNRFDRSIHLKAGTTTRSQQRSVTAKSTTTSPIKKRMNSHRPRNGHKLPQAKQRLRPLPANQSVYVINQHLVERQMFLEERIHNN